MVCSRESAGEVDEMFSEEMPVLGARRKAWTEKEREGMSGWVQGESQEEPSLWLERMDTQGALVWPWGSCLASCLRWELPSVDE